MGGGGGGGVQYPGSYWIRFNYGFKWKKLISNWIRFNYVFFSSANNHLSRGGLNILARSISDMITFFFSHFLQRVRIKPALPLNVNQGAIYQLSRGDNSISQLVMYQE